MFVNGRSVQGGPPSYERMVVQLEAEEAHKEARMQEGGIELIDESEFRGTNNLERQYRKFKNAKEIQKGRNRRRKQMQIYSGEIRRFRDQENENRIKEGRRTNYLYFLKKIEGNLFEHKYEWRKRKDMQSLKKNSMREVEPEIDLGDLIIWLVSSGYARV